MSGDNEALYEITSVRHSGGYFKVVVFFPRGATNHLSTTYKPNTDTIYYIQDNTDELGAYITVKEYLDERFKNKTITVLDPPAE